ncbi:MAG: TrkA family potassium uptake protein [Eggerthellaceae bacterium]|nr:TrkA family potassium uptake protein [Eggerthellaceae bacterium]
MGRNIIVVGCGRVGSQLASMLSEGDNNVCVIDQNPDSFANLGGSFNGTTIEGVGFDEDVLLRAGVDITDCVAAVTAHDNANLMVAEVASRIFRVPHVIARLYNPGHERTYEQLGLDYVCGTSLVAEEVFAKISSGHGSHVDSFGDFEILRFSLDLKSRSLRQVRVSQLEKGHDIRIVAFERDGGRMSSIPTGDSILQHGDSVLACVRHSRVAAFSKWMQEG